MSLPIRSPVAPMAVSSAGVPTRSRKPACVGLCRPLLTMSRMDRLYGVTMAERGVSQLVSVDLQKAETLIAAE